MAGKSRRKVGAHGDGRRNSGRSFGQRGEWLFRHGKRAPARALLKQAAHAYERATANDPDDWYAHHYLAFNRDVLGEDVEAIEQGYKRALELRPQFVWNHSRLIRFLVTCGRNREAELVLGEAARELIKPGQQGPASLYAELHADVARSFLQFGRHEQASKVLQSVPERARAASERYERLVAWAAWQREADRNESVFPPGADVATRWKNSVFATEDDDVVSFVPGRLADVRGQSWRFHVATRPGNFSWRELSQKDLERLGAALPLPVGTFVDFLTVKVNGAPKERLHRHPSVDAFSSLEVRYPAPDRFLDA